MTDRTDAETSGTGDLAAALDSLSGTAGRFGSALAAAMAPIGSRIGASAFGIGADGRLTVVSQRPSLDAAGTIAGSGTATGGAQGGSGAGQGAANGAAGRAAAGVTRANGASTNGTSTAGAKTSTAARPSAPAASTNPSLFAASEAQLQTKLARAVGRGRRGL